MTLETAKKEQPLRPQPMYIFYSIKDDDYLLSNIDIRDENTKLVLFKNGKTKLG